MAAAPVAEPTVTLARRHVAPELSHAPLAGRLGAYRAVPLGRRRRPPHDGDGCSPSPSVIERCLGEVQARSYKAVVTNALGPAESAPFVDAGFAVRERLHLLAHDLDRLPPATGSTRRARRHDYPAILDLDATAFDGDWHLDHDGLVEALHRDTGDALPHHTRLGHDLRLRHHRPVRTKRVPPAHRRPRKRAQPGIRPHAHRRCALVVATPRRRPRVGQHTARQHGRALAVRIVRLPAPPRRAVRARADALRRAAVVVLAVAALFALAALPAGAGVDPPPTTANANPNAPGLVLIEQPAWVTGRRQPPAAPPGPGAGGGRPPASLSAPPRTRP